MIRLVPVDTMPEFEPLTLETSNLMLEAKSLRAQGEPFEAAVKWVEAGRKLAELGTRLLHADLASEAAHDILYSAECFLEAGSAPDANEQIERFETLPLLTQARDSDQAISTEYERIHAWAQETRRGLDEAWDELRGQMRDPHSAKRLKTTWIDRTLSRFPGVPGFHFYAARKYAQQANSGKKNGTPSQTLHDKAIAHLRWNARLQPEHLDSWIMVIAQLEFAGRWKDAATIAADIVKWFPERAKAHANAAITKLLFVAHAAGPKKLLEDAAQEVQRALKFGTELTPEERITLNLTRASCLYLLGRTTEGDDVFEEALQQASGNPRTDFLLIARAAPMHRRRHVLLDQTQQLFNQNWSQATARESALAGVG